VELFPGTYARPGVEQACLQLQSAGVNVCLLLCAAWLGQRGVACNEQRLQRFAVWLSRGNDVVQPLRALRTQWKTIAMLDADLHGLREQVKTLELEAERHLLLRLERSAQVGRKRRTDLSAWLEGVAAGATTWTATRCVSCASRYPALRKRWLGGGAALGTAAGVGARLSRVATGAGAAAAAGTAGLATGAVAGLAATGFHGGFSRWFGGRFAAGLAATGLAAAAVFAAAGLAAGLAVVFAAGLAAGLAAVLRRQVWQPAWQQAWPLQFWRLVWPQV
jgi:uncharacterized protein (TIGR02444 family)